MADQTNSAKETIASAKAKRDFLERVDVIHKDGVITPEEVAADFRANNKLPPGADKEKIRGAIATGLKAIIAFVNHAIADVDAADIYTQQRDAEIARNAADAKAHKANVEAAFGQIAQKVRDKLKLGALEKSLTTQELTDADKQTLKDYGMPEAQINALAPHYKEIAPRPDHTDEEKAIIAVKRDVVGKFTEALKTCQFAHCKPVMKGEANLMGNKAIDAVYDAFIKTELSPPTFPTQPAQGQGTGHNGH